MEMLHGELTGRILEVFYAVYRELGPGYMESVYANAMAIALEEAGIAFEREASIEVSFRGRRVGLFRGDFVVDSRVLLELKAQPSMPASGEPQALNFLRGCRMEVALVLNFGKKPEFARRILTNDRKHLAS